jgi:hypothetical protein
VKRSVSSKRAKSDAHLKIIDAAAGSAEVPTQSARQPIGLKRDNMNWSCPYDSVITILANLWAEDISKWNQLFPTLSLLLRIVNEQLRSLKLNSNREHATIMTRKDRAKQGNDRPSFD